MGQTFYFYDLETSGFRASSARVMQFAGQRVDLNLDPIGESDNVYIKMTEDVLPDPDAVLVTGITPQKTLADGVSEAEFLKLFHTQIALPDTVFIGYNSVRFDDEFMRYLHWRNFYDPYEWQWKDGRSRWDILDAVRMTRALRPEGIEWPFAPDGKPTVRLELLTQANGLDHANAHEALNDVMATLAVARLLKTKQPKLFEFLLRYRDKKLVEALIESGEPFVYTSGRYRSEYEKTSIAVCLSPHPAGQAALVYDLRVDPARYDGMDAAAIAELWQPTVYSRDAEQFAVKTMKYNHCPAVAPLSVLDAASEQRIQLDKQTASANLKKLRDKADFVERVLAARELLDKKQERRFKAADSFPDQQLYDGFTPNEDRGRLAIVRSKGPKLQQGTVAFKDQRLNELVPLYKARNFLEHLDEEERSWWDSYRQKRLLDGGEQSWAASYFRRLSELEASSLSEKQRFLVDELQLYGQSILPVQSTER